MRIALANKEKTPEQQLPVLILQTLLYTFLVSVSPVIKKVFTKSYFKVPKVINFGIFKL